MGLTDHTKRWSAERTCRVPLGYVLKSLDADTESIVKLRIANLTSYIKSLQVVSPAGRFQSAHSPDGR
jgi:hypothetical protein